ncbi:ATP-dependent helicase HrpB [Frigidibacter sp. ROC022]|uniref:ATP-dependent helicase HrpB n=1 Tax=Frigidibacter sp. ROC022 TaxID=2971796 RepID=UPI00215A732D|nr:ATP-dependent helicase HrpB [Frigidibacter sp. ROC022]MCR8722990.1 ATP-dependent helicase HrpB [Frigidibacter sp. ROC022]
MSPAVPLPIDEALPELLHALQGGAAVLQAPPGAGKTTRVPLAMLEAGLVSGRIVMLEPRRLAARAAAERMAETLGEPVGQSVGYRIRGEAKVSKATRVEVVTEGILTRMVQGDPELPGVGAVIFDEFHERGLNADLGLALVLELRAALRPDLLLLVMSATLDAEPVAGMIGAPVVTSAGRAYPVETRWLDKSLPRGTGLEGAMADLVLTALAETRGGVLAFLPGEGEIRRLEGALKGRLPGNVRMFPLYGALPPAAQRAALAPLEGARKLVLATSIAETSLTIDGIRVVVDAGLARRARFDPGSGMSRLVTERVSRAEATQRQGRAGRVAEGRCYRLWTKGEEGALAAFPPAEIEVADLAPLALELALWGSADLSFLTPPPAPALAEAQALLEGLGALDRGRITDHGRRLATLPLHPRLGHMLRLAGPGAAPLAALLSDRDPLRGAGADLAPRMALLADPARFSREHALPFDRGQVQRLRDEARRLARLAPERPGPAPSLAEMAALAYPDRIGLRRKGEAPRFLLSGGKGAVMDGADPLAGQRLIVVTDTDGDPREARVRQAVAIPESALRELFADRIGWVEKVAWSRRDSRVTARRQERLGVLVLDDRPWSDAPPEVLARAALEGLRLQGLTWTPAAARLRARIALLAGEGMPDVSDAALLAGDALLPALAGCTTAAQLRALDLTETLRGMLTWEQARLLDRLAPASYETPMGRKVPIDYDSDPPAIEVRLQEMFGTTRHPTVGGTPLKVTLLSPAGRPLQVTTDLPGFWASSYSDVRKDMRGRYPRHPWPEDPTEAAPTLRAKPRGR